MYQLVTLSFTRPIHRGVRRLNIAWDKWGRIGEVATCGTLSIVQYQSERPACFGRGDTPTMNGVARQHKGLAGDNSMPGLLGLQALLARDYVPDLGTRVHVDRSQGPGRKA